MIIYQLGRHFIALFLIVLFAIRLSSQRSTQDKELRYFWLTLVCCFLLVLEDVLESTAGLNPDLIVWRTVLSIAGYVLRSVATVGLMLVVCKPEHRHKGLWIPCVINLLVCSTALFSDIAFGFDAEYNFYRGPLGYVAFIVPLFYLAVILWLTFKRYGASERPEDKAILIACAVFVVLSALLDATQGGVRLHEAILISCVFFYVFLRSYDIRRDGLTRLLSRQSLYDDISMVSRRISAMAALDMNGLKQINEEQGFSTGDEALRKIGEIMTAASDSHIRAYRVGGDEFAVLFDRRSEAEVQATLEKIRLDAKRAGYSISYGYVMNESTSDPNLLIRAAEMKMYEQKARYYRDKAHDRRRKGREKTDGMPPEVRRAVETSPQPMAVYRFRDHSIEPLAVSDGFCLLFGYPDRDHAVSVLDQDMYKDIHPDDQERYSGAVLRFSDGKEDLDVVYRTREGMKSGYRVIHARGSHLHTNQGSQIAYVWYMDEGTYIEGEEDTGSQISRSLSRALHEESILHAAHFDELTGLPNLSWFFKLSEAWKAKAISEGKHAALLYIDLNGMKYYNHRNGFAEGDRLLKSLAEILVRIFGKENCCHISGDHFAATTTEAEAEAQVKRLIAETGQMNGGKTLPVRVGIYSSGIENVAVSSAYDRAKLACDAIRRTDSSGYAFYTAELSEVIRRHQYLVDNIDRAIEERWIQAYYQPIIRAVSEKVCDEEALARWNDPVEGFLSPEDFIPQLEDAGLIYKLDLCVLDQVLEKMQEQKDAGLEVVPHSINLSRSDFETCDIVEEIRKRVDDAGVGRNRISIEITESIIGSNLEFMKTQINRFRDLGFPVWMDDFGSGYSSLDVLRDIPFDLIKFDMSFMRKLDESESGKIILTDLMKMATSLNVDTICEGVETESQVRFLQEIGCSKLQGYYFCKPISKEQVFRRYAEGKQIGFESEDTSSYYETIGRADLYDISIIASADEDSFHRTFSTLPMAIIEIQGDEARFIRSTPSYREFMKRFFSFDIATMARKFGKYHTPFMDHMVKACCEQGSRSFFDEKMPDGSVVHSFARRISIHPTNGNQAVAVAVLSISEPQPQGM